MSDALVIFGLTGDLGEKELLDALIELETAGLLPPMVVSVDREERSPDELRRMLVDAADSEAARAVAARVSLRHLTGDAAEDDTYERLGGLLSERRRAGAVVAYAALPPDLFASVAAGVGRFGDDVRLVVEKPFGSDEASARALYDDITSRITPDRLFLVDHFLAKSSVENLMAIRWANPWLDDALRAGCVERVEITMTETFGIDGRGSFYDSVGAVRDVVQNHMLAMVAMIAMEPVALDDSARSASARTELLAAVRPLEPDSVTLGQYDGYRDAEGVDAESRTETFVRAQLYVDNDRWRGVPFLLTTGKCLAEDRTAATVRFSARSDSVPASSVRVSVVPDSEISLDLVVLDADSHRMEPITLRACGPSGHGELGDYAVMLHGALRGDRRHFSRIDDVLAGWAVVDPLLRAGTSPVSYRPGSRGPTT